MSKLDLNALNELPKVDRILALAETNAELEKLDAEGRVAWALDNLPGEYVLSSSFGIQAAVSLHLVNQIRPDIPVILTDTGYLFPETYRFIDELTDKLKLNLKVYRATESAAWQEARYGKLWEQIAGVGEDHRNIRANLIHQMQAHRRLNAKAGGKYIFTGQIFQRPGDAAFSVQFFQFGVSFFQLWHSGGGEPASGESDSPGYSGDPHRHRLSVPGNLPLY